MFAELMGRVGVFVQVMRRLCSVEKPLRLSIYTDLSRVNKENRKQIIPHEYQGCLIFWQLACWCKRNNVKTKVFLIKTNDSGQGCHNGKYNDIFTTKIKINSFNYIQNIYRILYHINLSSSHFNRIKVQRSTTYAS